MAPFRPRFSVGDIVYLVESAKLGSLESYTIAEVRQDLRGQAIYRIGIPARPPTALQTVGDRITLKRSFDFELSESELTDLCSAIEFAKAALERQLARINDISDKFCSDETDGTGTE